MTQIRLLPLTSIDTKALPRDRARMDETALAELTASIRDTGLRTPVEVFALPNADPAGLCWGLISGHRRLTALTRLAAEDPSRWAEAPCLVRRPDSRGQALRLMVEENDIRAGLTPWEQGRITVRCRDTGEVETLDAAIALLYPAASRQRRARLRGFAHVVDELDGYLAEPHSLSSNRMERLAAGLRGGFGSFLRESLDITAPATARDPAAQWAVIENVLRESLEAPRTPSIARPGRPKRVLRFKSGLVVRRERTRLGWALHFSGPEAVEGVMEEIMDRVEGEWGVPKSERAGN